MKRLIIFIIALVFILNGKAQNDSFSYAKITKTASYMNAPIEQRIEMLQMPEEQLSAISDQEVLDYLLTYPLNQDIMLTTENLQKALGYLFTKSNIHKEVLQRKDKIARLLLEQYVNLPLTDFPQLKSSKEKLAFLARLNAIGSYLSISDIIKSLNKEDVVKLKTVGMSKAKLLHDNMNDYGSFSMNFYSYPLVSELVEEGRIQKDEKMYSFYYSFSPLDDSTFNALLNKVTQSLKSY